MRFLMILAVAALTTATAAVTDADRVQVYHDFRTEFDAHRYREALPLAQKLVSMTEAQYGSAARALANPLSNPLTDSLVALDRHDEAARAYDYSIRVADTTYGKSDLHVMRPLERSAHWQERMGHYTTARVLYARALRFGFDAQISASGQHERRHGRPGELRPNTLTGSDRL
jgi:hypothetical protein